LFCSKYDILIKYTIVPLIVLSIIAVLSTNAYTWRTSEIHQFYLELIAVILASVLAFYYILRAHTFNDKFSLFVGVGFLASALIDLLHVIVVYVAIDNPMFLEYFIPQTWFAGRIFLSAMLVMAIIKYPSLSEPPEEEEEEQQKEKRKKQQLPNKSQKSIVIIYFLTLAILAASVAISSIFFILPDTVVGNYSIHRPYEILPIILFTVALLYFYKNHLHEKNDAVYKGLLSYLMIGIFSEIIMSYSVQPFDTAYNVAHILKDAGYFINIIALELSSIQYNQRLTESNESLRRRGEIIRIQYERLKESDKVKNEFINVAAHELRTPIQPILTLTEILRSKTKEPQQQELLDIIIRNAKRSKRLTSDILDVTKIESHSLALKKERFNLSDMITNTIADITSNNELSNTDNVKFLYQPENIYVEADEARISQVVYNLLSNAVKFTAVKERGQGGEERTVSISVESTDDNSHVLVTVKDTGIGITSEVLPRLFEKFVSKSFQGTGLGLFISKSIVEAHGGRIWAKNNTDGEGGATFTFTLPLSTTSVIMGNYGSTKNNG
jgi:signal transduction histidine kinase